MKARRTKVIEPKPRVETKTVYIRSVKKSLFEKFQSKAVKLGYKPSELFEKMVDKL